MTAQRIPAGAIVLAGEDLRLVAAILRNAQAARARAGRPPHARLDALVNLAEGVPQTHTPAPVASAPMAEVGHADTTADPDRHHGLMSTSETATILGCSERQARRLAPGLGGRRVGGQWLIDAAALTEHLEGP